MLILQTVDSTNAYVKRNWRSLSDGEGVLALNQTAGRGRLGRSWHSERGGLYLSVYLQNIPSLLPLRAALAVRDALPESLSVRFKWPNDLLLRSEDRLKKASGILCEGFEGGCVVGVGVNLRFAAAPPVPHAVSLEQAGVRLTPEAVGEAVCSCLREWVKAEKEAVLSAYKPLCETLGRTVTLPDGRNGFAFDLASDGCLLVRTASGEERIVSGEVLAQGIY